MTVSALPKIAVAEHLAQTLRARCGALARRGARQVRGVAARRGRALRRGAQRGLRASGACRLDDDGPCTAIGHARTLSAAGAAFVNGTAAHGEDFDDTFEGGPVHAGAVIVPAVLAACERDDRGRPRGAPRHRGRRRDDVPAEPGRAEAHPQGGLPSDRGVRRDGRGGRRRRGAAAHAAADWSTRSASPARWRAASSSTWPKAAWTKRMHAGWAAQSGLRAALLARAGFRGPRTVFEGTHGLFHGFAHTTEGDLRRADRGDFGDALGDRDAGVQALSVRDHDAALHRLRAAAGGARHQGRRHRRDGVRGRRGHRAPAVGAARRQAAPANGYAGKFATPYCIAAGFVRGNVGLERLHRRGRERPGRRRARRQGPLPDRPANPYPNDFTGHIRATLRDGRVLEERQPHMRGGAHEPLSRAEIEDKFVLNARHGGWTAPARAGAADHWHAVRRAGRAHGVARLIVTFLLTRVPFS